MRYFIYGLLLLVLFSCRKNDKIEYRIQQTNNGGFYSVKLFDKNNSEVGIFNFDNNGSIISYSISDNSRNFNSIANLHKNGIAYSITDGNRHQNTTNVHDEHSEIIMQRREEFNGNMVYDETIDKNGFVVKER